MKYLIVTLALPSTSALAQVPLHLAVVNASATSDAFTYGCVQ